MNVFRGYVSVHGHVNGFFGGLRIVRRLRPLRISAVARGSRDLRFPVPIVPAREAHDDDAATCFAGIFTSPLDCEDCLYSLPLPGLGREPACCRVRYLRTHLMNRCPGTP